MISAADGDGHGAPGLFDAGRDGPVLRLHVQPGANREGVVGVFGHALKLRVQAPAASGKANHAVLRLLAREFGAPAASLSLTAGETSRDKRVLFAGVPAGEFADRLARVLARAQAGDPT
jgi:uncharacterized protein (TIGR00251 family)